MKRGETFALKLTCLSTIIQQSSRELCCATSSAVNTLRSLCMHPSETHSRCFFTSTCVCIAVLVRFTTPFAALSGDTASYFQRQFQTFMRTTPLLFGNSYKQSGLYTYTCIWLHRVNRVHPGVFYAMVDKLSIRSEPTAASVIVK